MSRLHWFGNRSGRRVRTATSRRRGASEHAHKRQSAAALFLLGMSLTVSLWATWCEGAEQGSGGDYAHYSLSLASWFPLDTDTWNTGYAIRLTGIGESFYMLIGVGEAKKKGQLCYIEGDYLVCREYQGREFGAIGMGLKILKGGDQRRFVGVGATVYAYPEDEDECFDWSYLRECRFVIAPEVTSELILFDGDSFHAGIEAVLTIGTSRAPPIEGISVGLALFL